MLRRKLLLLDEQDGLFVAMSTIIVTQGYHAPMFQFYASNQTFAINAAGQQFQINANDNTHVINEG